MSSKRWSDSKFGGFIQNKKHKDHIILTDREQEEKMEAILWINHTLANASYSTHSINDVTKDLCDGIVLGKLMESITGEVIRHHSPPMSNKQKLDNIQAILSVVNQRGVSTTGINPEDVVRGNLRMVLTLCREIRQGIFVKDNSSYSNDMVSLSVQKDLLLVWAGDVLDREITDYSVLRNGLYICDLINIIHNETTGTNILLTNVSPQKCLTNAVQVAEKYFGLTVGPFDVMQVIKGENDAFIQAFLQQLKDFKSCRLKRSTKVLSNSSIHVGDGFGRKDSSWSNGYGDDNYRAANLTPPRMIQDPSHSQMMSSSQVFDHEGNETGITTPQNNRLRISYSTDHLYTHSNSQQSLPFYGNESRNADGKSGKRSRIRPSSVDECISTLELNRGASNRQGDIVMPSNRYPQLNQSNPNIGGPQPYSLSRPAERNASASVDRSQFRYPTPSSSSTVEYSYSNDIPMPVTIYRTSSRTSIHSTSSRSSMERNSTDEQLTSLAYSTIPSHMLPPEHQTEKLLRGRSNSGNGVSNIASYSSDHLLPLIDDLNCRVVELSEIMLEERNVLIQKMIRTVGRERKKRQELEKKYSDNMKKANDAAQRYESCLVHLGKEVSKMSDELISIKEQLTTVSSLDKDMRVEQLVQHNSQTQQRETIDYTHQSKMVSSSGTGTAEKGKKNIFSRKKS